MPRRIAKLVFTVFGSCKGIVIVICAIAAATGTTLILGWQAGACLLLGTCVLLAVDLELQVLKLSEGREDSHDRKNSTGRTGQVYSGQKKSHARKDPPTMPRGLCNLWKKFKRYSNPRGYQCGYEIGRAHV